MKLKITLKNHFLVSWQFWVYGTIFIFLAIVVRKGATFMPLMFLIFSSIRIYMHIEYYLVNRGQVLEMTNRGFTLTTYGETRNYAVADINNIVLYKPMSGYWRMNAYQYAVINMKNSEQVYVTCLMIPDVKKFLYKLGMPYTARMGYPLIERSKRPKTVIW